MANANITKFYHFEQFKIRSEGDLVNLNDLYVAAESPSDKQRPNVWMRNADAAGYALSVGNKVLDSNIEFNYAARAHLDSRPEASRQNKRTLERWAMESFNLLEQWGLMKRKEGRGGGTWAHKVLAVEYAGYLSPEFKVRVNDTFLRVQEGDDSVIDEAFANQSLEKQKRTAARIQSKVIRNQHTETLKAHQVTMQGYGLCTNATYKPLLGGTANDVRKSRNLPAKANVREHLSLKEIAAVMFSEALADEAIVDKNLIGDYLCSKACLDASVKVASIL